MESPITMGEAGDNVCKEKGKHTDDEVCVNGDLSSEEPMEECAAKDTKAPEVNANNNCEKVPENKVPKVDEIEATEEQDEAEKVEETNVEKCERMEVELFDSQPTEGTENEGNLDEEKSTEDDDDNHELTTTMKVINGTNSESSVNGSNELSGKKGQSSEKGLNDSGDVVLVDESEHKENGDLLCSSPDVEEVISVSDTDPVHSNSLEVINLVSPPKKKYKKSTGAAIDITPRRSSRNINRQKSYVEKEDEEEEDDKRERVGDGEEDEDLEEEEDDPDVEEVTPEDPLAVSTKEKKAAAAKQQLLPQSAGSTIVVSDTKRLVEIAANSKSSSTSGKKEPTLVIIDTNSILSGRGPVPVSHKPSPLPSSFSMMPVALPAQGVYPPNMRATITPIPMAQPKPVPVPLPQPPAPILPTLTDDMYVVEAPSFIVPYVYEKPPVKPLREFVAQMQKEIRKEIEKERQREILERQMEKDAQADSDHGEDTLCDDDDDDDDDTETQQLDKCVDSRANEEEEGKGEELRLEDGDHHHHHDQKKKKEEEEDSKPKNAACSSSAAEISESAEGKDGRKKDEKKKKKEEEEEEEIKTIDLDEIPDEKSAEATKPKSNSYFDNALGQFFMDIGYNLVQEFVQTDLLKQQKRKQNREGSGPDTKLAISSLLKNLEYSKENNEPYKMEQRRCEFCSFKTESSLVLSHHLETPHMRNYVYRCNFCPMEVRSPHDILFHMEAEHNTRGRLERAPAFHQCPSCPFEDNQKGKLSRHLVTCAKKFKPERNLEPPIDWEPPAKIPRAPRVRQQGITATAATYQALAQAQAKGNYQLFSKLQQAAVPQPFPRSRGRPSLMGKVNQVRPPQPPIIRTSMMYRPSTSGGSVLVPTTYQFGGNQLFQVVGGQGHGQSELGAGAGGRLSVSGGPVPAPVALVPNLVSPQSTVTIQNSSSAKSSSGKVVQQPSISITPLPRQPAGSSAGTTTAKTAGGAGLGTGSSSSGGVSVESSNSKATFVICEICDGYIKDLEQLRNHMQWIHKVKIHPKMIYNRPPLNCQKCQFRFFTDQGLERHLLGSHGLVTSSMQEAANKSKDAGRCPVCGRVYQWKLLNHVARDHSMTLKPAHLSYKCTVCTATFGMYKQFENHVYSAHSVVAKRVMDKKTPTGGASASSSSSSSSVTAAIATRSSGDSLLKPLKINDEITIIPQPAKTTKSASGGATTRSAAAATTNATTVASLTAATDRGK